MKTKKEENSTRRTATIVGVLFIIATVASIVGSLVILDPILKAPNYLLSISQNETQVIS
jgi:type IV secretory pathway component VirB8